jgi:hypothetical protein
MGSLDAFVILRRRLVYDQRQRFILLKFTLKFNSFKNTYCLLYAKVSVFNPLVGDQTGASGIE